MSTADQQAKAPADLKSVAVFLRGSSSGMKARTGVLNGKRIDYFKGKSAVKALLSPAYAKLKAAPKVTSESEATALLGQIVPFAFYLRVDRGAPAGAPSGPKALTVNPMQMFAPDEYYAWFYDGPQWTTYVGGAAMVAVILAGVMFPLWPPVMRQGVSWLSYVVLGLIGLLFAIAVVRLIFYVITVVAVSPGIWIFPNLFADVGFVDSFIPGWEWDVPKKKKGKKAKGEKGKRAEKDKDGAAPAAGQPQGAFIEEVAEDSELSRPTSTGPTVEEVPE